MNTKGGQPNWHILTPEYPPKLGGVADYTKQVALALAGQGRPVHVWVAGCATMGEDKITVHALPEGPPLSALQTMSRFLAKTSGQNRILVQWVPHGFGYKSMNVPLCVWLLQRALAGDQVDLMIHEPFLRFREGSWRQDAAAAVHRLMISLLLRAATRVWVSTPDWVAELKPWAFGRNLGFEWLPVPNNIPVYDSAQDIASLRAQLVRPDRPLLGHFGTFGTGVRRLLQATLPKLLVNGEADLLLMGPGSQQFRASLLTQYPDCSSALHATGALSHRDLSLHLSACDLLVQPYPDGVNGRRGSVMAALAHSRAVVTTHGRATEPIWMESGAVLLADGANPDSLAEQIRSLLDNRVRCLQIAQKGQQLYERRFGLERTVEALLQ